ncbi:hypothetical protein QE152_g28426 [Popillia japonica]|uniref:Uncharacterized protein n=1 Tax=Popillia japonica TaxID=7064 RepID=A0AAW1JJ24_POPJA
MDNTGRNIIELERVEEVTNGLVMDKGNSGTLGRRGLKGTLGPAGMRRQRSLEWRQDRAYSSSEEDIPQRPVDSHVFASLLAQAQQEYSNDPYLEGFLSNPQQKGFFPTHNNYTKTRVASGSRLSKVKCKMREQGRGNGNQKYQPRK